LLQRAAVIRPPLYLEGDGIVIELQRHHRDRMRLQHVLNLPEDGIGDPEARQLADDAVVGKHKIIGEMKLRWVEVRLPERPVEIDDLAPGRAVSGNAGPDITLLRDISDAVAWRLLVLQRQQRARREQLLMLHLHLGEDRVAVPV
jgi:hypothetical protein